jgi:hypothetical protein
VEGDEESSLTADETPDAGLFSSLNSQHTTFMNKKNLYKWAAGAAIGMCFAACHKDTEEPREEKPEFELGSCQAVAATGHLTASDFKYTFTTSGGGKIEMDLKSYIKISHADYTNFTLELWGGIDEDEDGIFSISDNHENVNGKHVKDRPGSRRTIIFPDGAKMTLVADGKTGPLQSISIYDGAESHHINVTCNTVEESLAKSSVAQALDDAEADGETGTFEFTETGLLYKNIYTEDEPGKKVENVQPIAELNRDNPNQVIDYFD